MPSQDTITRAVRQAIDTLSEQYGDNEVKRALQSITRELPMISKPYEERWAEVIALRQQAYILLDAGKTQQEVAAALKVKKSRVYGWGKRRERVARFQAWKDARKAAS